MTREHALFIKKRSCLSKVCFNRKDAKHKRKYWRKRDKGMNYKVYKCPFCKCHHLGHKKEGSPRVALEAAKFLGYIF